jgi:glycosyltransferase involved in cell wall biosynthesis
VIEGPGVDLLHVHFAYPALGVHLRTPRTLPVVRTYYGSWAAEARVESCAPLPVERMQFRSRWLADALSLRRSRRVIVLSEFSRGEVTEEFRVPQARVDLVPGGVDLERFHPGDRRAARLRLGLPLDRPILLTVRRLVPRMGLEALLEAWARVRLAHPRALLLIGGKGPLAESLAGRAEALALGEQVRFLGFVPDEDLPLYYQAADAFVLPTRALEGFGLPTLEAFASGLPVLGTPVAATPELLRQVEPRLILPGTGAEEIAAGLRSFLSEPLPPACTPDRLRQFAERGYSWERVATETLSVYERALG